MSYKYTLFSFDGVELGHTLAPNDVEALFQIRGEGGMALEICADQGDPAARYYLERSPTGGGYKKPEATIWVCSKT